ncbi:MAG: hypothetical protein JNK82_16875 [Myxococcaceae bacterium]|nr:hypothetical protein [Myxococcaceae bacterium]
MAGVTRFFPALVLLGCIEPPSAFENTRPEVSVQKVSVAATGVPKNVTLVLDRSFALTFRAVEVGEALAKVVEARQGDYRFGLSLAPAGPGCGATAPVVLPGGDVAELLAQLRGVTATDTEENALAETLLALPPHDTTREDWVVLLTGAAGDFCAGDLVDAAGRLSRRNISPRVVNLGYPSPTLDDVAAVGGKKVFAGRDATSLKQSLDALFPSAPIAVCTYALPAKPAGPAQVEVLLDGEKLRYPVDWELVPAGVQLFGGACEKLQRSRYDARVELELRVTGGS